MLKISLLGAAALFLISPFSWAQSERGIARTEDYNRGLFYDQKGHGVDIPPMELEYDLSRDEGKTLMVGDAVMNQNTFLFAFVTYGKIDARLSSVIRSDESSRSVLVMRWPEALFRGGTIEMISKTGSVLWKMEITPEMIAAWKERLEGYKSAIKLPADQAKTGIFANQYIEEDVKGKKIPFFQQRENFRFCLTSVEGRNQGRLCSRWYATRTTGKKVVMGTIPVDPITPRVLVENEPAEIKGSYKIPGELPVRFFAELRSGETCDFVSRPEKLQLMDIVNTPKPNEVRLIGTGTPPTIPTQVLNPDEYGFFTRTLGFESTIGDTRKYWMVTIPTDRPYLYFSGNGGGLFKQPLGLDDVPNFRSRPYVHYRTPQGTYTDDFKIYGRKTEKVEVGSSQNSVVVDDDHEFVWYFGAPNRGEINRSYLDVKYRGKTYRSYFEVYKGFPRELSGRFSGILSSSGIIVMGEVAYNQWFEDVFGWTNYWLARQRWGISAKYFRSLNQISVSSAGDKAPLSVITADLKYRLSPGLWGRDETLGLIGSYQSVTFGELKAPMAGAGAFWARSMPRVFDDIFNLMPFMRYPKWVDMELIFYGMSMKSDVKLETNFALNFHGKVLWTKRIFGEAGFGLKRYAFSDVTLNQKAALNTAYGTVGLGISF